MLSVPLSTIYVFVSNDLYSPEGGIFCAHALALMGTKHTLYIGITL